MNIPYVQGDIPAAADISTLLINGGFYGLTTGSANTYILTIANPALTAYSTGLKITFKANFTNTGAATINVNSLGAKAIVKNVSTPLVAGDLLSGQIITVIYDGTNFVIQNTFLGIYTNGVSAASTVAGVQNIAHGLGTIPKRVKIYAQTFGSGYNFPNVQVQSTGIYNGVNTSTITYHIDHNGSGYGAGASVSTDTTNIIYIRVSYDDYSGITYYSRATITVDSTNISLSWSIGTGSAGAFPFMWEAEA